LGNEIAARAFAEWLKTESDGADGSSRDRNAATISDALHPLIASGELRILEVVTFCVEAEAE